MRLDKFLAECGFGTRSEVKKLIKKVNLINIPLNKEKELKILLIGELYSYTNMKDFFKKLITSKKGVAIELAIGVLLLSVAFCMLILNFTVYYFITN